MQQAAQVPKLPWWFFPSMAFSSAVAAVWGYNTVGCGGLVSGVMWTIFTFCLLMFIQPEVLAAVLLVFASSAGIGLALSAHRLFRERKELLSFLLPVAALLIGIAVAKYGDVHLKCSLGTWM